MKKIEVSLDKIRPELFWAVARNIIENKKKREQVNHKKVSGA